MTIKPSWLFPAGRCELASLRVRHYPDGSTPLGHPTSDTLRSEIARIRNERVYRPEAFFIRSLGFVTPTEARRINLADSIRLEICTKQRISRQHASFVAEELTLGGAYAAGEPGRA